MYIKYSPSFSVPSMSVTPIGPHNGNPPFIRWMGWGFLLPALYGGAIELIQKYFTEVRSAEWGDWIADVLGSLCATLIVIILIRKGRFGRKNISL